MSLRSEPTAGAPGRAFGRRIVLPARIRSFPVFRIAAIWEAFLVAAASLRHVRAAAVLGPPVRRLRYALPQPRFPLPEPACQS